MIDSHAHIYLEHFKDDLNTVISDCKSNNISKVYMPNINFSTIENMLSVHNKYPEICIPTLGLHPCYVKQNFEQELYKIEAYLSNARFAAIGEIGIDLFHDKTFLSQQTEAFKIQISWAKKYNLPVVIHTRNSFENVYNLLKKIGTDGLKGIFHCFTGTMENAEKIIDMGFMLGIGGVITFKNSGLEKVIKKIDLQHIVLETDSPYLSPVPFRGKRNEPAYLEYIANTVANIKNISLKELDNITSNNALETLK